MVGATIYTRRGRFHYYDTYDTYKEAFNVARQFLRKFRARYMIVTTDKGYWFPEKSYRLYTTKVFRL